jgi:hypothetical protein
VDVEEGLDAVLFYVRFCLVLLSLPLSRFCVYISVYVSVSISYLYPTISMHSYLRTHIYALYRLPICDNMT